MIPTSVFLGRYDQPTIDKAASFIALAGEIAKMPGGDSPTRWGAALAWVCEHAGGVDRSKGAAHDAVERRDHDDLDSLINSYVTEVCEYPDRTSPIDQPGMLLIIEAELRTLLRVFIDEIRAFDQGE